MQLLSCAALLPAAVPALAQDVPAPGFGLASLPYPAASPLAATTTLSTGEIVVFDGTSVRQFGADGTLLHELGSLPGFSFPSFVLVDPDEQQVFIGESSAGGIYRLFVGVASAPEFVASLPFNYDAAMLDTGALYVSAATCGFGCGSEIWRVDLGTLAATLEASVSGASGPLAFDEQGGLYYGTVSDAFPPPPGASAILHWRAAQLAAPAVLMESDGQLVGGGFSGAARLTYDAEDQTLLLLENDFGTGANRIRRVQGSAGQSPVLVDGRTGFSLGNASFHAPPGPALFHPHQPASGGTLVYTTTDFASTVERLALSPRRAVVSLSGPGTTGAGTFDVTLDGGPANGFVRLFVCPSALYHASESVFFLRGLPLFFGLDLPTTAGVPGLLALDPQGHFSQSYSNPGTYQGQFALQYLLLDAQAHVAGTSAAGFL